MILTLNEAFFDFYQLLRYGPDSFDNVWLNGYNIVLQILFYIVSIILPLQGALNLFVYFINSKKLDSLVSKAKKKLRKGYQSLANSKKDNTNKSTAVMLANSSSLNSGAAATANAAAAATGGGGSSKGIAKDNKDSSFTEDSD